MSDLKQIVNCGCGGEPVIGHIETSDRWYIGCPDCDICTSLYNTETEVITAWNRAMGERTAKAEYSEPDGCYLCGGCGYVIEIEDVYCAGCGARLDWGE